MSSPLRNRPTSRCSQLTKTSLFARAEEAIPSRADLLGKDRPSKFGLPPPLSAPPAPPDPDPPPSRPSRNFRASHVLPVWSAPPPLDAISEGKVQQQAASSEQAAPERSALAASPSKTATAENSSVSASATRKRNGSSKRGKSDKIMQMLLGKEEDAKKHAEAQALKTKRKTCGDKVCCPGLTSVVTNMFSIAAFPPLLVLLSHSWNHSFFSAGGLIVYFSSLSCSIPSLLPLNTTNSPRHCTSHITITFLDHFLTGLVFPRSKALQITNVIFTFAFVLEITLKLFGLSVRQFWSVDISCPICRKHTHVLFFLLQQQARQIQFVRHFRCSCFIDRDCHNHGNQ